MKLPVGRFPLTPNNVLGNDMASYFLRKNGQISATHCKSKKTQSVWEMMDQAVAGSPAILKEGGFLWGVASQERAVLFQHFYLPMR
jgi:hypothetical protein